MSELVKMGRNMSKQKQIFLNYNTVCHVLKQMCFKILAQFMPLLLRNINFFLLISEQHLFCFFFCVILTETSKSESLK